MIAHQIPMFQRRTAGVPVHCPGTTLRRACRQAYARVCSKNACGVGSWRQCDAHVQEQAVECQACRAMKVEGEKRVRRTRPVARRSAPPVLQNATRSQVLQEGRSPAAVRVVVSVVVARPRGTVSESAQGVETAAWAAGGVGKEAT